MSDGLKAMQVEGKHIERCEHCFALPLQPHHALCPYYVPDTALTHEEREMLRQPLPNAPLTAPNRTICIVPGCIAFAETAYGICTEHRGLYEEQGRLSDKEKSALLRYRIKELEAELDIASTSLEQATRNANQYRDELRATARPKLDEAERQMVLRALAVQALFNPGFDTACWEAAKRFEGIKTPLFHDFKRLMRDIIPPTDHTDADIPLKESPPSDEVST